MNSFRCQNCPQRSFRTRRALSQHHSKSKCYIVLYENEEEEKEPEVQNPETCSYPLTGGAGEEESIGTLREKDGDVENDIDDDENTPTTEDANHGMNEAEKDEEEEDLYDFSVEDVTPHAIALMDEEEDDGDDDENNTNPDENENEDDADEEDDEEEGGDDEEYANIFEETKLTTTTVDEDMIFEDIPSKMLETLRKKIATNPPVETLTTEVAAVGLLAIVQKNNAPLGLYKDVAEWGIEHAQVLAKESLPSRKTIIETLTNRYNLKNLKPKIVQHVLPTRTDITVDLVVHDINTVMFSLLSDPSLMVQENLLFDLNDPTKIPDEDSPYVGDVNTGELYFMAHQQFCKDKTKDMLVCPMFFIDGTHLTQSGSIKMEPVFMTLAIFNRKTRQRPEAYRVIGYIKNQSQVLFTGGTPNKKIPKSSSSMKYVPPNLRDYHSMLGVILSDFKRLQTTGFEWTFNGTPVHVWIPILCIMGDTLGHDKLCCLRGGHLNGNPICRYCMCKDKNMDDPRSRCRLRSAKQIIKLISEGQVIPLKDIHGIYPLVNGFTGAIFCDDLAGLYGACPAELLHYIQKGWYEYGLKSYYNVKDSSKKNIWTDKIIYIAERKCLRIGLDLQRQSDRSLPRTHFPTGYFPKKSKKSKAGRTSLKRSAQEIPGLTLVQLIFLLSDDEENKATRKKMNDKLDGFIHIFDLLLTYEAWLKSSQLEKEELRRADDYIRMMMARYKDVVDRDCRIRKFHYGVHQIADILRLGVPLNVTGHMCEANFKYSIKNTYRNTQKRQESVEEQTAIRHTEHVVISRASAEFGITNGSFYGGFGVTACHQADTGKLLKPTGQRVGFRISVEFKTGRTAGSLTPDNVSVRLLACYGGKRDTRTEQSLLRRWKSAILLPLDVKTYLVDTLYDSISPCKVTLFTEYIQNGIRYRANPVKRKCARHDWAYVRDKTKKRLIPCHLLAFVSLEGNFLDDIQPSHNGSPFASVDKPGLYGLVHYVPEDPFGKRKAVVYGNDDKAYTMNSLSRIARWSAKACQASEKPYRKKGALRKSYEPYMELVPLSDIDGPCIAIPDPANTFRNCYTFVRPRSEWASIFSARIVSEGTEHDVLSSSGGSIIDDDRALPPPVEESSSSGSDNDEEEEEEEE